MNANMSDDEKEKFEVAMMLVLYKKKGAISQGMKGFLKAGKGLSSRDIRRKAVPANPDFRTSEFQSS